MVQLLKLSSPSLLAHLHVTTQQPSEYLRAKDIHTPSDFISVIAQTEWLGTFVHIQNDLTF